jgi:hypothetical protein
MEGMQAPKLIKNLADEPIHVPVKMYNHAVLRIPWSRTGG